MSERGDDEVERILAQRARELAQPLVAGPANTTEVVIFSRSGSQLGVPSAAVSEVLQGSHLARLPAAPPALVGICAVRGDVVVVADPAHLLDLSAPDAVPEDAAVVVLDDEVAPLGLLVDSVERVALVERPATASSQAPVAGVTADGVVLLDVASILADPRTTTAPASDSTRVESDL